MIQTQVRAAALPVERWLEEYCKPEGASGPGKILLYKPGGTGYNLR